MISLPPVLRLALALQAVRAAVPFSTGELCYCSGRSQKLNTDLYF